MLDWDDLKFFLALARGGTLTAAARALDVTQPTVGRRIAAFEERLGAKLFAATPGGHVLSSTGRRLVEHAARMEAEAISAERLATGRDTGLRGRVVITANEWVIELLLAPLIEPLVGRHPGLVVELLADTRHLNLLQRDADIALRPARFEQQDVVAADVGTVAFGLYASDRYLASRGAPDFSRKCEGHTLIAMSESVAGAPDSEWLGRVASHARVVASVNSRTAMSKLAAAGIGIACLPRPVGAATPGVRVIPTPSPGPERHLWLGVHRDARGVPRVKHTVALLKDGLRGTQAGARERL